MQEDYKLAIHKKKQVFIFHTYVANNNYLLFLLELIC